MTQPTEVPVYLLLLTLHSWIRWVALGALVARVARAGAGLARHAEVDRADRLTGLVAMIAMDVQLTLGIILYVISPTVQAAQADMGAAMKNAELRFFAVEHGLMMIIAVVGAHVAHLGVKRAKTHGSAHRIALFGSLLALLLVLAAIPWPFREAARPLLRLP